MGSLIVVAGLKRSGTTWMFNVVRLALPHYRTTRTHADISGNVILKTHRWKSYVAERAALVFSSHRDPAEVEASLIRFGEEPKMGQLLNHYALWDAVADYRMDYDELVSDPVAVAGEIIATLGSDADPQRIADEVAELKPPERGIDPVTFYHAGHFT